MSDQSKPQEYVIITDSSQANNIPYGYEIAMRGGRPGIRVIDDTSSAAIEEVDARLDADPIPHIISHALIPRVLDDGTVLADIELTIESVSESIELRLSQGEAIS